MMRILVIKYCLRPNLSVWTKVKVTVRMIPGSEEYWYPVVQSIVSLTISLRHKFVKQISAKVTNTLLFFVEKM